MYLTAGHCPACYITKPMKLRCTHNSIRLRIRKSELDLLRSGAEIREVVNFFGGATLGFSLSHNPQADTIQTQFSEGCLAICLPTPLAKEWMDTDKVALENFQPLPTGEQLHVLIEKDFPCKDRPEENRADFFGELADRAPKTC